MSALAVVSALAAVSASCCGAESIHDRRADWGSGSRSRGRSASEVCSTPHASALEQPNRSDESTAKGVIGEALQMMDRDEVLVVCGRWVVASLLVVSRMS